MNAPIKDNKILFAFLAWGAIAGLVGTWWSYISDSPFLPNLPAVLLGDQIYILSVDIFGNPHSGQAHYTVPWLLRIPQVYVFVSFVLWGLFGLAVKLAHRAIRRRLLLALCACLVPVLLATGCSQHPEGLDNPRALTEVEKSRAIEIALATAEAKEQLEKNSEYRTELHWLAVVWSNSEWSSLRTLQYDWKTDPNYKLVSEGAAIYPAVTITFGNPEEWVVTVAVALDQAEAALVQEYPAQKGPKKDMEIELAPIHEVRINIAESYPPQVVVYIKGGLRDDCTTFHDLTVRRDGSIINVEVTTQHPPGVDCAAVYNYFERNKNLGSDFISGERYTVKVNDQTTTFVMQ